MVKDSRFLVIAAASGLVLVNVANISIRTDARPIIIDPAPVYTETIVIDTTEAPTTAPEVSPYTFYSVNGQTLSEDLQTLLQDELRAHGIEWFYKYALCQIYQESRFNPSAQSKNGKDQGLCQFRKYYFREFAVEAGYPDADVWDPVDSIKVYAYLMSKYISKTDSVEAALSYYYLGEPKYSTTYVNAVMQWYPTIEEH